MATSQKTASPVPVLCIPADVWHKTFDFSFFTLTQMAGGDHIDNDETMTCFHLTWKSECQNRVVPDVACTWACLRVGVGVQRKSCFRAFWVCFHTVCACLCFAYWCQLCFCQLVLCPSTAAHRRIWAPQVLTDQDGAELIPFTLSVRWQRPTGARAKEPAGNYLA